MNVVSVRFTPAIETNIKHLQNGEELLQGKFWNSSKNNALVDETQMYERLAMMVSLRQNSFLL